MTTFFPKNFPTPSRSKLTNVTIRNFGGGLNAVDSDMNMDPRFQCAVRNSRRTSNGSQRIRFGSQWFADVKDVVSGTIVDMEYFVDRLICVMSSGEIAAVNGAGEAVVIWNEDIAAELPGEPTAWTEDLTMVDFVSFGSQLIVHNGVDKPITINSAIATSYLVDLATGSNINTPIGKYGCVVQNYHCVAGIPAAPTKIYISAIGTAGTFPGDPIPNDSISIDVGAYAPEGASEIRAIAGFRAYLLVFFTKQTVVVKLGTYSDSGIHIPEFPDSIPQFGVIGHRCLAQIENDILFVGLNGLNTAKRNILSGFVSSSTLSDIIEPAIRTEIGVLTDSQQKLACFLVYDALHHDTSLFLPSGDGFIYSANDKLKYQAWSTDTNVNWTCACVSFLGRVFGAEDSRIYQQGNIVYEEEDFRADRIDDRIDDWAVETAYDIGYLARDTITEESYTCVEPHTSGSVSFSQDRSDQASFDSVMWEIYLGEPIHYFLELPWLNGDDPLRLKFNKYISINSRGTSSYTVKVFVDGLYKDFDGNIVHDPALEMDFVADNASGFGYQDNDTQPFGGGRRGGDPRLWKFPVKFKTLKVIIEAITTKPIEIGNLSFLFSRGGYKR